jgi:gamma-glutamyltranspeptidase/glutathione hydrolase
MGAPPAGESSKTANSGRVLIASGTRFALATPHHLATQAGRRAFEEGGNALDAALAAAAMLAVVYPHQCSPGGDLFAVVSAPPGRLTAVNGSGAAPAGIDPEEVRAGGVAMPDRGPLTITVPGVVAGWETLADLGARLGLARALEPAVAAAEEGVPVAPGLARAIAALAPVLAGDPGMAEVFLPDGGPLADGSTLRQPSLARTLEAVAGQGADILYRGDVAQRLAAGLGELDSPMTGEDLAAHQTQMVRPLGGRYRDREILTSPPNSQGFALLQILAALERMDPSPDPLGASFAAMEVLFRAVSEERDRWLCDPRRTRVPLDDLLGQDHLDELVRRARDAIGERAGGQGLPRPGRGKGAGGRGSPERSRPSGPSGDTVAVVAMDAEGYAVSLIQSVFETFGSGILEPSTGLILHNRGTSFSLDPAHPAVLEGGVRPPHTLTPVLVLGPNGGVEAAVGAMGGRAQPQILAQVLVRLLDHGAGPEAAVSAPRWVVPDGGVAEPGDIVAEPEAAAAMDRSGALPGHRLIVLDSHAEDTGHAQAVVAAEGSLTAGSDPRADGTAAAG